MAWYLPFLLLTIFRPNLEDRVAVSVLKDGWLTRPKLRIQSVDESSLILALVANQLVQLIGPKGQTSVIIKAGNKKLPRSRQHYPIT